MAPTVLQRSPQAYGRACTYLAKAYTYLAIKIKDRK
jgi:hypothetical protein